MDLSLTPEQEMLKNTARRFLEQQCPFKHVKETMDSEDGFDRDLWKQVVDLGWTAMLIPEEYGGIGSTYTDVGILLEELGRGLPQIPFFSTAVLGALTILEGGSDAQKQAILPAIAEGGILLAFAYTEPSYRWDAGGIELQATASGSNYTLNGTKLFVPDAQVADQVICVARTSKGARPEDGLTLFLVDRESIEVRRLPGFLGEPVTELTFNNVSVPAANVIGTVDGAWNVLDPVMDKATILLCAYMVGGTSKATQIGLDYSNERVQFGRPIGAFTRVQDHVINCINAQDAARWTAYEGLSDLDAGKPVAIAASVAKAAASDGYTWACDSSHEIHGGMGISREYPLHLYTMTSRTLYAYLGDTSYHKQRLSRLLEF